MRLGVFETLIDSDPCPSRCTVTLKHLRSRIIIQSANPGGLEKLHFLSPIIFVIVVQPLP
jgi:hypothetical protein